MGVTSAAAVPPRVQTPGMQLTAAPGEDSFKTPAPVAQVCALVSMRICQRLASCMMEQALSTAPA